MIDREKVVERLTDLKELLKFQKDILEYGSFIEDINDALALLKEQEAVEPNPVHNSFRWFACGKCDCSITIEDRFCPRCGRAVKWGLN